jgi:hypothetical protein
MITGNFEEHARHLAEESRGVLAFVPRQDCVLAMD